MRAFLVDRYHMLFSSEVSAGCPRVSKAAARARGCAEHQFRYRRRGTEVPYLYADAGRALKSAVLTSGEECRAVGGLPARASRTKASRLEEKHGDEKPQERSRRRRASVLVSLPWPEDPLRFRHSPTRGGGGDHRAARQNGHHRIDDFRGSRAWRS